MFDDEHHHESPGRSADGLNEKGLAALPMIEPVYPLTEGISANMIVKAIDAIDRLIGTFRQAVGPKINFEFVIMKDADHGFGGHETELGTLIADWITF